MVLRGTGVLPREPAAFEALDLSFGQLALFAELSRGESTWRAGRTSACRVAGPMTTFNLVQYRDGSVIDSQPGLTKRPTTDHMIVGNFRENANPLQSPADA